MEQIAAYSLRPVREADEALLLEIYSSTRAEELALVPWDAAQKQAFLQMQFSAQQKHYRAYFPQAKHEMVQAEGHSIGRLYVDRRETEIRILDITLLPQARGRGIGRQIILDLMKEAEYQNKPLSVYVESFNRSLGLFQRLGFVKTEENGASWLMAWRADA
ncbi:MAG TPA: GNAT family N-acetyltransferase [Anaerolineales bacterium]|nr:GNAT family N-acetyltransferase [Anaerolineales bacterium]